MKFDANKSGTLCESEFDEVLKEIEMDLSSIQREQQMMEMGAVKNDNGEWGIGIEHFQRHVVKAASLYSLCLLS